MFKKPPTENGLYITIKDSDTLSGTRWCISERQAKLVVDDILLYNPKLKLEIVENKRKESLDA